MSSSLYKWSYKIMITFSLFLAIGFFASKTYAYNRELTPQIKVKPVQVAYYYRHYNYHPYRPYRYYRYYGPRHYYYRHPYRYR